MPANDVVITANFIDNGPPSDDTINMAAIQGVTVPVKGAAPVSVIAETAQYTGSVEWHPADNPFAPGTVYTATITLLPKDGYTLNGVAANFFTVAGAVSVSNAADSGVITVVFPATAKSTDKDDSDDEGDNSGGGGGNFTSPSSGNAVVSGDGISGTTLKVDFNTNTGNAAVDIGALKGNLFTVGGTTVITMPSISQANNYTVEIPKTILSGSQGQGALTLSTNVGSITMPANMLSGVSGDKAGITIGQHDKSGLPEDVKAAIGDRPLIQLTLTVDGKQTEWNNPDAPVTVSIPYTPTAAELADPEHITVWYIDGSGNVVSIPSGRYDAATGKVIFSTTHFSNYAIAFVSKTFNDLGSAAWAKKSIEVLASKGILKGVSEEEYAPQNNITRAEYLYFLIRTLGADAKAEGNFDDISKESYYYKEIAIAKALGITGGTGNNRFSPDERISRQDMTVMTERALRIMKMLKVQETAWSLDKFTDSSLVADYAVNSVGFAVKEGLPAGSGDKLNPLGNTTRAEAAVFLYRLYNKFIL